MANQNIVPSKFTDGVKEIYLKELAATGLRVKSAHTCGVTMLTVRNHLDDDPEFAEAYEEALDTYKETVRQEVHRRSIEGWDEPVFYQGRQALVQLFDDDGKMVMENAWVPEEVLGLLPPGASATGRIDDEGQYEIVRPVMVPAVIRKYSDRLLELEAKRVDPAYRDKGQLDVNVGGGILVVPGMAASDEEWRAKYGGKTIEQPTET